MNGVHVDMYERIYKILSQIGSHEPVAVVTVLGSFCPITLGHVQMFLASRDILLHKQAHLSLKTVIGFLGV